MKWDMNRPLTEVFSLKMARAGEDVWQSETCHRYILGLYNLQERLTTAFPDLLLENCASGGTFVLVVLTLYLNSSLRLILFEMSILYSVVFIGGRFDPGMLFYSPQIWASDNTDAVARVRCLHYNSRIQPQKLNDVLLAIMCVMWMYTR